MKPVQQTVQPNTKQCREEGGTTETNAKTNAGRADGTNAGRLAEPMQKPMPGGRAEPMKPMQKTNAGWAGGPNVKINAKPMLPSHIKVVKYGKIPNPPKSGKTSILGPIWPYGPI